MSRLLTAVLLFWGACAVPAQAGDDWAPVSGADLASTVPMVEPDADAEVLFWDVHIEDKVSYFSLNAEFWQYVRIKIFTDRGAELHGKVTLPFASPTTVDEIEGRTIKRDGSVAMLQPGDVFENALLRAGGRRWRTKTFALPGVEAGAIIEYRWHEVRRHHLSMTERLEFQHEIPVRSVVYHLWPLSVHGELLPLRSYCFNAPSQTPYKDPDGFLCLSMDRVPAFREEPHMPPEPRVKPWVLVDYPRHHTMTADEFWRDLAQSLAEADRRDLRPTREVARVAAKLVNDARDGADSLARLYAFCQREIRNLYEDDSTLTPADRARLDKDRVPGAVLNDRTGTPGQINRLFAALAAAVRFEVRSAWAWDGSTAFNPAIPVAALLDKHLAAVRGAGGWMLLDPGSRYLPMGRLRWEQQGTKALLVDPHEHRWLDIHPSPAESSRVERSAILTLAADGALEGTGRIRYTGHHAIRERDQVKGETTDRREQRVRDLLVTQVGPATLTDIRIEDSGDPSSPPSYSFRLRMPGFAQRVGSRMILHPGVFQHRATPVFRASERRHPIWFEFAWSELDSVEIALPPGFAVEGAADATTLRGGEFCDYARLVAFPAPGGPVLCTRSFRLFDRETPVTDYAAMKLDLDRVTEADSRTIVLREGGAVRK